MAVLIKTALERICNGLLKIVLQHTGMIHARKFQKQLKCLEKTLQSIIFCEIWKFSEVLDRPQKEITACIVHMKKGKELLLKCSRVQDLNTNQKFLHLYKLYQLNNELLRFFKVDMDIKKMSTSMRSLSGVSDLAYKMDQLLLIEGKPLYIEQLAQPTDEAFDSICYDLTAPKELEFDGCYDLKELPSGICSLVNLRTLSITNCHELDGLPKALGNLLHLENLSLRCCTKLQELPESIGGLRNLNSIDISDCLSISVLPEEIGELSYLRVLKMSGCRGLQELPMSMSNLCQLNDVTCDEETWYLWMNFESDLYDLKFLNHTAVFTYSAAHVTYSHGVSLRQYLLEFTSEYGISEDLHLELPGPEERIVDFPKGKDEMPAKDTYSPEAVAILNTHRTPIQKQPEALLCLVGLSQRYFLGDDVYLTFLHDDDRDMDLFNLICALNPTKVKIGTRPRVAHEVPLLTVTASCVIEMEDPEKVAPEVPPPENVTTTGVAPETGLVDEIAAMGPRVIKKHRKRSNDGVGLNAPPKVLRKDHVDSRPTQNTIGRKSLASMGLETGSIFPVPTSQETPTDVSDLDPLSFAKPQSVLKQDVVQSSKGVVVAGDPESENTSFTSMVGSPESIYQLEWGMTNEDSARENEIKNLEALLEAETDMKKAAEAKNAKLVNELENLRARFTDLQRYAKMDARLDALIIDFDKELYPHMLTAIAGRRWVIGHGIAKGMSEGLKYGVEHGKANLDLEAIEAYDPEADTKYVKALHALRDLKYPVVDQLESLKDAPIDVIMASLNVESDSGEDAPQWIRELHPKILLEDAITANVSRAEKKKKCRVVCRTHGVGFAHHARSDGVLVSVPTVAPQSLVILLADAATHMKTSKNETSPRLLRSKSLPSMYNLDLP
nr:disease resistance protein [Tanacetum cinerariifolium]